MFQEKNHHLEEILLKEGGHHMMMMGNKILSYIGMLFSIEIEGISMNRLYSQGRSFKHV
jgi:hypothetical protein